MRATMSPRRILDLLLVTTKDTKFSKNASQTQPAKPLAMIFAKKGSTLTTPVG